MPVTTEQRQWINKVIGVGEIAPTSNEDLNATLFTEFLKARGIYELVTKNGNEEHRKQLTTMISEVSTGAKALDLAQREADRLWKIVTGLTRKVQDDLSKKFGEYTDALKFARSVIDAEVGDLPVKLQTLKTDAQSIETHYLSAREYQNTFDYSEAMTELEKGLSLYQAENLQLLLKNARDEIAKETENSEKAEQKPFLLFIGDADAMRKFVADEKNLKLLSSTASKEELSPAMLEMSKVLEQCLVRCNKLKATGLSPYAAADIAFANIPRAFWPDSLIREIDLFLRAERALQIEQAQAVGEDASDSLETLMDAYESATGLLEDTSDTAEGVEDTFEDAPELLEKFNELTESITDGLEVPSEITESIGILKNAFGLLKELQKKENPNAGPVERKIAEFQRNVAIFDICDQCARKGLDMLTEVVPVLSTVVKAVDTVLAAKDAAEYFVMLHRVQKLGDKAKRDPSSAVYLPLVRMAKDKRLKAAEKVVAFITGALEVAGEIGEYSGIGAAGGLAIDLTGKIIDKGGQVVFKSIKWNDARKAQNALLKAKGPPLDRDAVAHVMKYSNRYATCCLAIAAVEDFDPWAIQFCLLHGLTEAEVADETTSIFILRKYILIVGDVDDEQKTFWEDNIVGKGMVEAKNFISSGVQLVEDKILGRNTDIAYEPPGTDDVNGTQTNPNYKDLTTVPALDRKTWQDAKVEATNLGWYITQTNLGDALDSLSEARNSWQQYKSSHASVTQNPTQEDINALGLYIRSIRETREAIDSIQPRANPDGVMLFVPLQKFLNSLSRLLDSEELDVLPTYEIMQDILNSSPEKRLEFEKAIEQSESEKKENRQKTDDLIRQLIAEQPWSTPFGKCRLDDYLDLVCSKLLISKSSIEQEFNRAVEDLKMATMFLYVRDHIGNCALDQLPSVFKQYVGALQTLAYDALTTLAVVARDYRDRSVKQAPSKLDSMFHSELSSFWKRGLEIAREEGMVDLPSNKVAEHLKEFERQQVKYKSVGSSLCLDNARIALRAADGAVKALKPLDKEGLPFEPMVRFLKRLRADIKNVMSTLDEPPQDTWMPSLLSPNGNWQDWWKTNKAEAVKNHLSSKSTGIESQLKRFDKLYGHYVEVREKNPQCDTERNELLKCLEELTLCVNNFEPATSMGKEHEGAKKMKSELLDNIELKRKETLEVTPINYPSPPTQVSEVTAGAWSNAKKQFVSYGMKEKDTGLRKALEYFTSKRENYLKDKSPNKQKTIAPFKEACTKLATASLVRVEYMSGMPFKEANNYLDGIGAVARKLKNNPA